LCACLFVYVCACLFVCVHACLLLFVHLHKQLEELVQQYVARSKVFTHENIVSHTDDVFFSRQRGLAMES